MVLIFLISYKCFNLDSRVILRPQPEALSPILWLLMFLSHFLCNHVSDLKPESNSFLLVLNLGYVFAAAALCMQGLHCMMAPFKKARFSTDFIVNGTLVVVFGSVYNRRGCMRRYKYITRYE